MSCRSQNTHTTNDPESSLRISLEESLFDNSKSFLDNPYLNLELHTSMFNQDSFHSQKVPLSTNSKYAEQGSQSKSPGSKKNKKSDEDFFIQDQPKRKVKNRPKNGKQKEPVVRSHNSYKQITDALKQSLLLKMKAKDYHIGATYLKQLGTGIRVLHMILQEPNLRCLLREIVEEGLWMETLLKKGGHKAQKEESISLVKKFEKEILSFELQIIQMTEFLCLGTDSDIFIL